MDFGSLSKFLPACLCPLLVPYPLALYKTDSFRLNIFYCKKTKGLDTSYKQHYKVLSLYPTYSQYVTFIYQNQNIDNCIENLSFGK